MTEKYDFLKCASDKSILKELKSGCMVALTQKQSL